jgi:hypothetical protein
MSLEFPIQLQLLEIKGITYFFEMFKVEVAVFDDVDGLVAKDLSGICFEDGVELFGK